MRLLEFTERKMAERGWTRLELLLFDLSRGLIFAQPDKCGVPQVAVAGPFDKRDFNNHTRLDPSQSFHILLGHAFAPPGLALTVREIHNGTVCL